MRLKSPFVPAVNFWTNEDSSVLTRSTTQRFSIWFVHLPYDTSWLSCSLPTKMRCKTFSQQWLLLNSSMKWNIENIDDVWNGLRARAHNYAKLRHGEFRTGHITHPQWKIAHWFLLENCTLKWGPQRFLILEAIYAIWLWLWLCLRFILFPVLENGVRSISDPPEGKVKRKFVGKLGWEPKRVTLILNDCCFVFSTHGV